MARGRPSKVKEDKAPLKSASVDEDYSKVTGEISSEELIAAAKRAGVFVYDIETNNTLSPREGRIVCVGFYVPAKNEQKTEVFALFPFVDNTMVVTKGKEVVSLRSAMPQADTMEKLRPIWSLPEVTAISANGKFEEGWFLINPGTDTPIICSGPSGDSMLADYISDERRRRYGLKIRVEEVFKVKMTQYAEAAQHQGQLSFMNPKPLGTYNMEDCKWTYMLHEHALAEIRKQDPSGRLEKIYWSIEMKLRKIIVEMETTGFLVDFEHLIELEQRLEQQKAAILAKIITSAGWAPNLRSPSQVSDFLFNSPEEGGLGLPTDGLEQNAHGDFSTSEKVIKHFGRKNQLVKDLLEYRSLEVIDRSFCKKLIKISQTEGRVYTGFNQTVAVTGRLTSSKPVNLQNMPRDKDMIRKAFVAKLPHDAESDLVILDGDASQVELRLIASIAQEPSMLEVYNSGGKCTCDRFLYWHECKDEFKKKCKWEGLLKPDTPGIIILPDSSIAKKCPSCGGKVEWQERCRHTDIHQRTAEDVGVPRNPLAKNCVIGDSLVATEHGLLKMSEIVEGAGRQKKEIGILSDNGEILKTESTFNGGTQKVVDVNLEYGMKITATPDHEFFIMRSGAIQRVPASKLLPNDNVVIMIGKNVHGNTLTLPEVKVEGAYKKYNIPSELNTDVAKFLGYFVSEGHVNTNLRPDGINACNTISFGFGRQDPDMVKDFASSFGVEENFTKNEYDTSVRYTITSKHLTSWLGAVGAGFNSITKRIPKCIRMAPWSIKKAFLQAYFEGDGTIKGNTLSVTSKSEQLIRQLHAELLNIDILGNINKETRKDFGDYWVWSVQRKKEICKFRDLVGFVSARKCAELDRVCNRDSYDVSTRFLDGVEPLLEEVFSGTKRKLKDKLREVLCKGVRFGDLRLELLGDFMPPKLREYYEANIWTAKVFSVKEAGEAEVFDLYEPTRTAMVTNGIVSVDCNFGISYRIGPEKFAIYADLFDEAGHPKKEFAKSIIDKWMSTYWRVPEWHYEEELRLKQNNWIAYTLTGRRRRLDEEKKFNEYGAVTQCINFRIQGTCQDLMKIGMIRVYEERAKIIANSTPAVAKQWQRLKFLSQVHDELIFECPDCIKHEAMAMIKRNMEGVAKLSCPIVFQMRYGSNWEEAH